MNRLAFFLVSLSLSAYAQDYTRGVGVYPGDPREYTGPALVVNAEAYRNLALHRPVYQSSAYDYNLTAQLATDGIKETASPMWIETSTSDAGVLPKRERELFLDGNVTSSVDVSGSSPWVQFDMHGGQPPEIDRLDLYLRKGRGFSGAWTYVVLGSDDGTAWHEVGRATGTEWPDMRIPGPSFMESIPFAAPARFHAYRVQLVDENVGTWGVAELALSRKGQPVRVAGPDNFSSAWMSAGSGEEWVYVDLGAGCSFDRITLTWIQRPAEGSLQVSDDASNWKTLQSIGSSAGATDDVHLAQAARGRYVRVLMTRPTKPSDRYALSEMEVFGRGGPAPVPHAAMPVESGWHAAPGGRQLARTEGIACFGERRAAFNARIR